MNAIKSAFPMTILLVEDNPGDVRLIQEVLKDGKVPSTLVVAKDGVEAMSVLRGSERHLPDLIMLDLNLPRKGGLDVLAEIKKDTILRKIPVIVLTTSSAEEDIVKSYDLYANAYLIKPVDLEDFVRLLESLECFWLTSVQYPSKDLP